MFELMRLFELVARLYTCLDRFADYDIGAEVSGSSLSSPLTLILKSRTVFPYSAAFDVRSSL
jgi:hypothetical protein